MTHASGVHVSRVMWVNVRMNDYCAIFFLRLLTFAVIPLFNFRLTSAELPSRLLHPQQHSRQATTRDAAASCLLRLPTESLRKSVSKAEVYQQTWQKETGCYTRLEGFTGLCCRFVVGEVRLSVRVLLFFIIYFCNKQTFYRISLCEL